MKRIFIFVLLVLAANSVMGESFTVTDIRLEGLQRVSPSPVFAAMPIRVGDTVDAQDVRDTIQSVFSTGLFTNVQVARDGTVLILIMRERPTIKAIEFDGNKALKDDQLTEIMADNGIAESEVLQIHKLQQITRELEKQYIGQSRYSAGVETVFEELPNNMVKVQVNVDEGKPANIFHINIVGNEVFSDKELLDRFELKENVWWKFFSKADQYSKQKLTGDIEKLESFYMDRGYLDFKVVSSQVSVSPDKESVYITLNVDEGNVYTVAKTEITGDPILPLERVKRFVILQEGDVFSQAKMTATTEYVKSLLGNAGYSNAEVKGVPKTDPENNTVVVNFFIDPGKRVYVRRINFVGNTKTSDEVLRREMRQHEGASASNARIEQSKVRLERLGFFKEVTIENQEIPGSDDLVDVQVQVQEQSSGNIQGSVGYAEFSGLNLSLTVQENNWLGTGKQVSFGITKNVFQRSYNFGYNDPYFTPDGVSRGFNIFYRERDFSRLRVSEFAIDSFGGSVDFGYPLSEIQRIGFGVGADFQDVEVGNRAASEILSSPSLNPGAGTNSITNTQFQQLLRLESLPPPQDEFSFDTRLVTQDQLEETEEGFINKYGSQFATAFVNLSWTRLTLNRGILATRGTSQRLSLKVTAPGSELQYVKFNYDAEAFVPLNRHFTLRFRTSLGYGEGYGDLDRLPFFENFFAGGFGSVRGYERSTLGPKGTPPRAYISTYSGWRDFNQNGVNDSGLVFFDVNDNGEIEEDEVAFERIGLGETYVLCDDPGVCEPGQLLSQNVSGGFINTRDNAIGGNILTEFSTELLLPIPFLKDTRSMQLVAFFDAGNVFSSSCGSTQIGCSNINLGNLSSSVGFGFSLISALGPMTFSISRPVNKNEFDTREAFQFTFGSGF